MILDKHPDRPEDNLKAIGYWKKIGGLDPSFDNLPNPYDFVGEWESEELKIKIVKYVKEASAIMHWWGWSECRFKCPSLEKSIYASKRSLSLGTSCLSDGTYVWPEGFYHYLEVHDVIPPKEFIDHVLEKLNES